MSAPPHERHPRFSGVDLHAHRYSSDHLFSETALPEFTSTKSIGTQVLQRSKGFAWEINNIFLSAAFEKLLCVVILGNFVVVILETDINADDDAIVPLWMDLVGWVTLSLFTMELIARMFGHGWMFWKDYWNLFDFAVIITDLLCSITEPFLGAFIKTSALRVLRLCRLVRLFRMFPELHLMVAGLIGAVEAVFWGSVLLFIVMLIASILAVQYIHPKNKELPELGYYDGCRRCPRAYESVFQSCLTFTQQIVAGDSWGTVTVPVIEQHPETACFFVAVYLCVGLSLMNLITGVVVTVADQARETLKAEFEESKLQGRMDARSDFLGMCKEMDVNNDGTLNETEFYNGYESSESLRSVLDEMSVRRDDLSVLWKILESEEKPGTVPLEDFVNQVFKMKTSEGQFLLTYIKYYLKSVEQKMNKVLKHEVSKVTRSVSKLSTMASHSPAFVEKTSPNVVKPPLQSWDIPAISNITALVDVDVRSCLREIDDKMGLEEFSDLIDGACQFRCALVESFQHMDRSLGVCLSRTSEYLRLSVAQAEAVKLDLNNLTSLERVAAKPNSLSARKMLNSLGGSDLVVL